jgi:putative tryptophan/tyrosine transport system substrate-binding protein
MDHVKRREFMGLLASAAATWPLVTFAQSPEHMRRIGVVMAYAEDDPNGQIQVEAFRETLATLGWVERRNAPLTFVMRGAIPRAPGNWVPSCSGRGST